MNREPSGLQTLPEYLQELERRDGQYIARQWPCASVPESLPIGQATHGQTLREALEEAEVQNSTKLVHTASGTPHAAQTAAGIPPVLRAARNEAHAGRRASDELRAPQAVSYRQQKTLETAKQLRDSRATENRTSRIIGRTYRQKTKITGVNPMNMPGAAACIERAHKRMREVTSALLAGPKQYQQRTRFTSAKDLSVSRDPTRKDLESAINLLGGERRDLHHAVPENGGSDFRTALGEAERTRLPGRSDMSDQINILRTELGLRVSADIANSLQQESEERAVMEGPSRKRARTQTEHNLRNSSEERLRKRARMADENESDVRKADWTEEIASIMQTMEADFDDKKRESYGRLWCDPVSHERKIATVQEFYTAFHELKTLPIQTCVICYRKFASVDLRAMDSLQAGLAEIYGQHSSHVACSKCLGSDSGTFACVECIKAIEKGGLSPAARVHRWLRCEHVYPDELKDLTPVEEKLIALNSCYGFITKYSVVTGHRGGLTYPKHVKGHITVFPNNVQELVTCVLPHPLLKVMDEIHVSWQGAKRPDPTDLSLLLSVRRRVVEEALVWLRRNNPHYAHVEIDTAEMESWGASSDGIPSQVYERLQRNEPSAWEKTRTAQLVPPTERGLQADEAIDVREILATLNEVQSIQTEAVKDAEARETTCGGHTLEDEASFSENEGPVQEISASGMFALDALPNVEDREKLQYAYDALGRTRVGARSMHDRLMPSATVRDAKTLEPYIAISRGQDFADSQDTWFFAKAFPTLFPFGGGGPRQAEEDMLDNIDRKHGAALLRDATASSLVSSRNLSLETWARVVLQRQGGRFATHKVFSFLVFNMLVRFRNHRVSMMSVSRKDFPEVQRIIQSLSKERLEKAKEELQSSGRTNDGAVSQLLRSLSLYGFRQPMSRELRLGMRRKIKSLIVREGIPAIWFTLNPNDITNPVKLRLAAYRTREPEEAEAFITRLDGSYKRMRLAVSDPLSSALFFHREISLFFKHYVRVGQPSVFGRISHYFGAVETNERGALHLHGLLWLHGNMCLSSLWKDVEDEHHSSYRDRILQYVDSVFTEVRSFSLVPRSHNICRLTQYRSNRSLIKKRLVRWLQRGL